MLAIGIMSGTSLDGVDVAICEIEGHGLDTKIDLIRFETYDIPKEIKDELKYVMREDGPTTSVISSLNFKLGYLFSDSVKDILKKENLKSSDIKFVATHGQTIYHIGKDTGKLKRSTLQIGEPAVIAYENKVNVISNFRTMDIAAGGEGAPLVPYSELIIYGKDKKETLLQNIGGIGNVTYIPKNQDIDSVFAFDTGPGNMIIDEAMKSLYNQSFDIDGKIGKSGIVNKTMLSDLMNNKYFDLKPPKSTGRELFGEKYTNNILEKYKDVKAKDIIATLTMFTAKTIAFSYKKFILPFYNIERVIIGGGGAYNNTLLSFIKKELGSKISVVTQEDIGFSSDAKEALAFVILGNETVNKSFSNVPKATGAKKPVILGNITYNPF